jgi:D-inositol-3-phosphate glycosyltransferase
LSKVTIVGPVYPFRAGIAYCTTRLAEELGAEVLSFARQYPKRFYPGSDDIDPTLPRAQNAAFLLDILNPLTWLRAGWRLRKSDVVIFAWWVWVWAIPFRLMMAMLRRRTRVILQCHNVGDKEPAWWKRALTNLVLRRANVLVTHAAPEASEAWKRSRGRHVVRTFLPVHELGTAPPPRDEARAILGIEQPHVALFFGHVRPFKALDVALRAWREVPHDVLLLVAGEAWWEAEQEYHALAGGLPHVRMEFRFVPDSEVATYFAAADVVLAPYRVEAQSGVALTAFHFARPVIASRAGGLPEIIDGTNGMLIDADDPHGLANAVREFFGTRDREAMERRAADCARKYSWEEYGRVFRRLVT